MIDAATSLWQGVFWVLVHGTVLALVAWVLAATVLRGARPAIIAALWTIVLLKFVVPVGPAMPWSLSSAIDALVGAEAPAMTPPPIVATGAAQAVTEPAAIGALDLAALAGAALWLGVAALLVARRIREHRALRRRALAAPVADAATVAVVAAVARRLGVRAPDVRVEDGRVPWVIGLGRPLLVLPAALDPRTPEAAAVIGHELAHLRRRDAWLRVVQVIAGALFFFWPVVRWVNRRIDAAREVACDAWAIERGPLAAHEYARLLVRIVREAQPAPGPALALAAHPHLLGRRVDALVGRRVRAGVGAPGIALLAGWGVLALGGAPDAEARAAAAYEHCQFTPELAAEILSAHPEADSDGDGELTRDEACDFQLAWSAPQPPMHLDALRLQCGSNGDTSASSSESLDPPDTCTQE